MIKKKLFHSFPYSSIFYIVEKSCLHSKPIFQTLLEIRQLKINSILFKHVKWLYMSGCYFVNDCDIKNERLGFQVRKIQWSPGEILSIKDTISMLIASKEKSQGRNPWAKFHLVWKRFWSELKDFSEFWMSNQHLFNPENVEPNCNWLIQSLQVAWIFLIRQRETKSHEEHNGVFLEELDEEN